jgi:hypothetical protein
MTRNLLEVRQQSGKGISAQFARLNGENCGLVMFEAGELKRDIALPQLVR